MRLAVFGGGLGATPHLKALGALDGIECVGVAELAPGRRREIEDAFGLPTYADYSELLERASPDAVLVALPHDLHVPAGLAALRAGAHVLVEKPLATTVEGCTQIIEAAADAGRVLMAGHTHHFYPNVVEAHRMVRSGEIGEVLHLTDTIYADYFVDTRPQWFFDASRAGGGSWMANGVHLVDRTCWILGEIPETIYAHMTTHPEFPQLETSVSALLQFPSGRTAVIDMVMQGGGHKEEGQVVTTEGLLRYSAFGGMDWQVGKAREPIEPTVKGNARASQLQEFTAAVREDREPAVTGAWGRDIVRVVLAGYESARSGRPVAVHAAGEG